MPSLQAGRGLNLQHSSRSKSLRRRGDGHAPQSAKFRVSTEAASTPTPDSGGDRGQWAAPSSRHKASKLAGEAKAGSSSSLPPEGTPEGADLSGVGGRETKASNASSHRGVFTEAAAELAPGSTVIPVLRFEERRL